MGVWSGDLLGLHSALGVSKTWAMMHDMHGKGLSGGLYVEA